MAFTQPVSRVLTDPELIERVWWPRQLSIHEIRGRIAIARRHIDFDGTLKDLATGRARDPFYGKPLAGFLAEEPFLVQTWGPEDAVPFFQRRPDLPQPLLILMPAGISLAVTDLWFDPCEIDPEFSGTRWTWKDLPGVGIRTGTVFDDDPHCLWAPGCDVVSTF